MAGKPAWVASPQDIPGRVAADPPWYPRSVCPCDLERVQVLVIQGRWPRQSSEWWTDTGATLIIRVAPNKERGGHKLPPSWIFRSERLSHHQLGGVTNGLFKRWWAIPRGQAHFNVPAPVGVPSTLGQVLKPTERGRKWCTVPEPGELNTGLGLLDWPARSGYVKAPSVFRKEKWLHRPLTAKESENVLDFPEARGVLLPSTIRDTLLLKEIPGKLWVAGFETVTTWEAISASARKRKRTDRLLESTKRKNPIEWAMPVASQQDEDRVPVDAPIEAARLSNSLELEAFHTHHSLKDAAGMVSETAQSTVTDKATKADGAAVPVHLWNNRVEILLTKSWAKQDREPVLNFDDAKDRDKLANILDNIRKRLLSIWKRRVRRSFVKWYKALPATTPSLADIRKDGLAACSKAEEASWWEWDGGSALFFWRWPKYYQETARVGVAPFFDSEPPSNQDEQPPYGDEAVRLMVKKKLAKVLKKSYIELCDIEDIEAMMYMFHVPKGEDDIRMVYDGSKSGLNKALWAPWFALPNIDTMARWVVAGSWLADNDYGEQFLNFPLHPDLRKYCGVDLTQLFPEWKDPQFRLLLGRWTRNAMGLRPSPYNSVQGALIAKHVVTGNPKDSLNPFGWDHLKFNLPGSVNYDATQPWIMKVRKDGLLASGVVQYIDDLRIMASTQELAWQCSSRMAKGLSYLGLQDAARKRRECTQNPGAWAGAVISSDQGLFKSVTQERWQKTRDKVRHVAAAMGLSDAYTPQGATEDQRQEIMDAEPSGAGRKELRFKTLRSITGFLGYVGMTYSMMVPYLKGFHLTLNSWRPNRDEDGWKTKRDQLVGEHGPPPEFVGAVTRFEDDVKALMSLTHFKHPPKIPVRALHRNPIFIVGDASGSGFGVSVWRQGSEVIHVRHGNWSTEVSQGASSNFREAANLALELRRLVSLGQISPGTEVWVFTDNSCAEKTFYKGSSTSPLLHEMIVELRKLEMEGALIIHYVWISGDRMIAQGTDGLSRGDFTSGVMAGENFLNYIPLDAPAIDREPGLLRDVLSWSEAAWKLATPEDWFYETRVNHGVGWIWSPPPCLARVALDELCEVRHMFPYSKHMFICPALMTGEWRKDLGKLADVMFTVPAGTVLWGKDQFEPLTVAFVCPLMSRYPWSVGRLASLDQWKSNLPALLQGDKAVIRGHMCKLWREMASGDVL